MGDGRRRSRERAAGAPGSREIARSAEKRLQRGTRHAEARRDPLPHVTGLRARRPCGAGSRPRFVPAGGSRRLRRLDRDAPDRRPGRVPADGRVGGRSAGGCTSTIRAHRNEPGGHSAALSSSPTPVQRGTSISSTTRRRNERMRHPLGRRHWAHQLAGGHRADPDRFRTGHDLVVDLHDAVHRVTGASCRTAR